MVEIPIVVRNKADVAGRPDWPSALPGILDDLADRWQLTLGRSYAEGTEAYVCDATMSNGTDAVLKVLVPRSPELAAREAAVLRMADGDGCARLFDFDADDQALLIERLGPSMHSESVPIELRHRLLAGAAQRLWRPAQGSGLPTGEWKADWLADQITTSWERLGRPCDERTIEHALTCAQRRRTAHDARRACLVHGDVHQWNALRAPDGTFKLVDPDGLLAEPEYDLGIIMREDPVELMRGDPNERARRLAALTGCDVTAIVEWGVVERVSTGLLCLEIDLQPEGDQMLAAAEYVTRMITPGRGRGGPAGR